MYAFFKKFMFSFNAVLLCLHRYHITPFLMAKYFCYIVLSIKKKIAKFYVHLQNIIIYLHPWAWIPDQTAPYPWHPQPNHPPLPMTLHPEDPDQYLQWHLQDFGVDQSHQDCPKSCQVYQSVWLPMTTLSLVLFVGKLIGFVCAIRIWVHTNPPLRFGLAPWKYFPMAVIESGICPLVFPSLSVLRWSRSTFITCLHDGLYVDLVLK